MSDEWSRWLGPEAMAAAQAIRDAAARPRSQRDWGQSLCSPSIAAAMSWRDAENPAVLSNIPLGLWLKNGRYQPVCGALVLAAQLL